MAHLACLRSYSSNPHTTGPGPLLPITHDHPLQALLHNQAANAPHSQPPPHTHVSHATILYATRAHNHAAPRPPPIIRPLPAAPSAKCRTPADLDHILGVLVALPNQPRLPPAPRRPRTFHRPRPPPPPASLPLLLPPGRHPVACLPK